MNPANATNDGITRRRLFELALAGTAIPTFEPLVRGREQGRAWAQTPKAGGTLKMAWASSPRTIDPALTIQGDEYMITQNVYDNLTRVDEKLQVQPMLATRWSADPQARVWTFTLRQGVKFHHGRELKASDVVFTFERILDPKTASPGRTALGPIEKVEAVDDYTVRFRMSSPYADLPVNLGVTFGRILPADRAGQDRERAVGHRPVPRGRVQARRAHPHGEVRGLLGQAAALSRRAVAGQHAAARHPGGVPQRRRRPDDVRGARGLHRLAGADARACRSSP